MKYRDVAETAFAKARQFYEGSNKSDNKILSPMIKAAPVVPGKLGDATKLARFKSRRDIADTRPVRANKSVSSMNEYPIMRGKMLIKAKAMSMNCGELADISAWYAYEETKDVKVIATVSLESPGDHCFCVVGPRNSYPSLDGRTVQKLDELGRGFRSHHLYAVDPWANICCRIEDYPSEFKSKMNKWATDNKRVGWQGKDGKTPEWAPPTGDYLNVFLASKMKVTEGF